LHVLLGTEGDRAERIQLIFSREYQADWQARYQLADRSPGASVGRGQ
jgi:hypothetical protein